MKILFLYLKFFIKKLFQNSLTAYITSFFILLSLKKFPGLKKKDAIRVLVFSDKRWMQGIYVLNRDSKIIICKIPDIINKYINSIFNARMMLNYCLNDQTFQTKKRKKEKIVFDKPLSLNYYMVTNKKILDDRIKKEKFIKIIAKNLSYFSKIECGITCGLKYSAEQAWGLGFHKGGIPFISLFKEFADYNMDQLTEKLNDFKIANQNFPGTAIGVINKNIKKAIEKTKVFSKVYVKDVGFLRFDDIFQKKKEVININKKKSITLFSETPFSSNIRPKKYARSLKSLDIYKLYFSEKHDEGFAKLFLNTHKIFIKQAEKNKNINFYIKPKRLDLVNEKKYKQILLNLIKKVTGKDPEKIKNLIITNENSLNLIKKSKNVICFNTTVVLESVVLGVAPIIPIFDEAKKKYSKNVFFKEDGDIVHFVNTHNNYIKMINFSLKNKIRLIKNKKKIDNFLRKYINYSNSSSKKQTILFIKKVMNDYKKNLYKERNQNTY